MDKMKKIFMFLAIFICFCFCDVVNAEAPYENKWNVEYVDKTNITFNSSTVHDNNLFVVGSVKISSVENGLFIKYDDKGKLEWEVLKENVNFVDIAKTSDGFIILGNYLDSSNNETNSFIVKYDFSGKLIWEKTISEVVEDSSEDPILAMSISANDNLIAVSFDTKICLYDTKGDLVKTVTEDGWMLTLGGINSNYLYIVSGIEPGIFYINKFDLKNYKKLSSSVIYEVKPIDNGDGTQSAEEIVMISSIDVNDKYVLLNGVYMKSSTYTMKNYAYLYDADLKLIGNTKLMGMPLGVTLGDNAYYISNYELDTEKLYGGYSLGIPDIKGIDDDFYSSMMDKVNDVKDPDLSMAIVLRKYDYSNKNIWEQFLMTNPTLLNYSNNGLYVGGSSSDMGYISRYEYEESLENWRTPSGSMIEFSGFLDIEEINGSAYGVGFSMLDGDSSVMEGVITKYNSEGGKEWTKYTTRPSMLLRVVQGDDCIYALGMSGTTSKLFIIKYDYQGNAVWNKSIDIDTTNASAEKISFDFINDKFIVAIGTNVVIYDKNCENPVKLIDNSLIYPLFDITDKYLYLTGVNQNYEVIIEKYDLSFNKVDSKVIMTGSQSELYSPISIKYINDRIFLVVDNNVLILDDKYNTVNTLEFEEGTTVFDVVKSKEGFALTTTVPGNCPGEEACPSVSYVKNYRMNLEKVYDKKMSYNVIALASASDNRYLSAGMYTNQFMYAVASKFTPPSFNVVSKTDGNGEIVLSAKKSESEKVVTFEAEPKFGYVLTSVVVKTASGKEIEVKDNSFIMPEEDVEVMASFDFIINPNTGLSNPYFVLFIVIIISSCAYVFIKKKKYI